MNLQKGLVGHWKMDGTDNEVVRDGAANDNFVDMWDTPTVVSGFIGDNAIRFEGSSSLHRQTSEDDSLDIQEEISISVWFTANSEDRQYIVSKNISSGFSDQQYLLGTNSGHLEVVIAEERYDLDDGYFPFPSDWGNTFDKWRHVVMVWDGGQISVYGDGEFLGSAVHDKQPQHKPNFTIGARANSSDGDDFSFQFEGKIEDLRIYNRELSKKEVKNLYNIRNKRRRKS